MIGLAGLRRWALGIVVLASCSCGGSTDPSPAAASGTKAQPGSDRSSQESGDKERRELEATRKAADQARIESNRARLALVRQQLDAGQLEEVATALASLRTDGAPAGDLKPLAARLAELQKAAKKRDDKLAELEGLVEQADWIAAAMLAEELSELQPEPRSLPELRAKISAGQEVSDRRSALLAEARQYLETGELARAETVLGEARSQGGGDELAALDAQLAAARGRLQALDAELVELRRRIEAGELDGATGRINTLLEQHPGHEGLAELRQRLAARRNAGQIESRLVDAKLALGRGELNVAAQIAADALQLDRTHEGLRALATAIQRKVHSELGLLKVQWANRRIKKDVYLKVLSQLRDAQDPLALIHPPLPIGAAEIPEAAEAERGTPPPSAPANNRLAWKLERGEYLQLALTRLGGEGLAPLAVPRARIGLHARQLGAKGDSWSPDSRWLLPIAAALLLPGQVVGEGQSYRIAAEFRTMRDLGPVQISLSGKRAGPAVFGQMPCFAIQVEGRWRPVAGGANNLTLRDGSFRGTLYWHPERGQIIGGEIDNQWSIASAATPNLPVDERLNVRFELDLVLALDGPRFQQLVDQTIALAIRTLRGRQRADGRWMERSGYNALALLALLVGGVPGDDPQMAAGIASVLDAPHTLTYDTALALMVLEARHALSPTELQKLTPEKRRAALDAVAARLSPAERAWAQGATRWLATSARRTDPYRWDYPSQEKGDRYDNSNTQYAALGLRAGATCGATTPPEVWRGIAEHWLDCQAASEGKVQLLAQRNRGSSQTYEVHARGWNYTHDRRKAYGSMTCGGIGSLAIALNELHRQRQLGDKDANRMRQSILEGIAWLQLHFDVTQNPEGPDRWLYYYLYGLERAGILGDFSHVGAHDWYREGALELVFNPERWTGDLSDTAFVLLFLRRGTYPVEISR